MRCSNHDLRGHAADVDTGASDRAALEERDLRAAFDCGDRRGHGCTARAEDRDLERRMGAAPEPGRPSPGWNLRGTPCARRAHVPLPSAAACGCACGHGRTRGVRSALELGGRGTGCAVRTVSDPGLAGIQSNEAVVRAGGVSLDVGVGLMAGLVVALTVMSVALIISSPMWNSVRLDSRELRYAASRVCRVGTR